MGRHLWRSIREKSLSTNRLPADRTEQCIPNILNLPATGRRYVNETTNRLRTNRDDSVIQISAPRLGRGPWHNGKRFFRMFLLGCFLAFAALPGALAAQGIALSGVGPVNRAMGGAATAAPIDAAGV